MKARILAAAVAAAGIAFAPEARAEVDATSFGPHVPESFDYAFPSQDLGAAFDYPPAVVGPNPVEIQGRYWAPSEPGDYPLVVLMHGAHASCFDPEYAPELAELPACQAASGDDCPLLSWVCTGYDGSGPYDCGCTDEDNAACELRSDFAAGAWAGWPCDQEYVQWSLGHPMEPIPSFAGYDETAEQLASHGLVVASISANGVWGQSRPSNSAGVRAGEALLRHHLDLWTQGAVAPIAALPVGLLGHSRGGESVARVTQTPGGVDVGAVMLLAASHFDAHYALEGTALAVVSPYCDGDLVDLPGNRYFDGLDESSAPAHLFTMLGANHGFFNTVWTPQVFAPAASDDADWPAQRVAAAQIAAELEASGASTADFAQQVGARASMLADSACSGAIGAQRMTASQQREALTAMSSAFFRTYVGREDDPELLGVLSGSLAVASPAGLKQQSTALPAAQGRLDIVPAQRDCSAGGPCLEGLEASSVTLQGQTFAVLDSRDAHRIERTHIDYAPGTTWPLITEAFDATGLGAVVVRLGLDGTVAATDATPEFALWLEDSDGNTARTTVSLEAMRGELFGHWPKQVLESVRVPLTAFDGIDLGRVSAMGLAFDEASGQGRLLLHSFIFVPGEDEVVLEPIQDASDPEGLPFPGAPRASSGDGCSVDAGGGAPGWLLILFGLLGVRRRRLALIRGHGGLGA